jgi:GrpB-like predicted nucleotidyltransferase (UPF0157 family)
MIDLYALAGRSRGLSPTELTAEERLELWRSVQAEIWPGFEIAQGSHARGDPIEVVDYDPAWRAAYESWRERIQDALGEFALAIEHVGSTSVPGLAAKPRIDIQVSVPDITAEAQYVPQLEAIGVELRSRDDYHRYFRPFPGGPRAVQVHVCALGSEWEFEHLLFRDYLRTHADARAAYAETKRAAAVAWWDDGVGYTDAKSEVVLDIIEHAFAWHDRGRNE